MRRALYSLLYDHLRRNYPDQLLTLQDAGMVDEFLSRQAEALECIPELQKRGGLPWYAVTEFTEDWFTGTLGHSRYNYVCSVLLDEFGEVYEGWTQSGILTYEVANLIEDCGPVFDHFEKEGQEDSKWLRYAIIGTIQEYLEKGSEESENVSYGL